MTDNEIIKAVECCLAKENCEVISCEKCPLEKQYECMDIMFHQTLDLINRQKAEIERLEQNINGIDIVSRNHIKVIRTQAIKEFAERLKERADSGFWQEHSYVDVDDIDNLVKEMTEKDFKEE